MTRDTRRLQTRIAAATVLAVCHVLCFAQSPSSAEVAVGSTEATATDPAVQTRHAITIEGAQLAYTATAGTLRVTLDKTDAEADVFYVSYHMDGDDTATRPITFGPLATAWHSNSD